MTTSGDYKRKYHTYFRAKTKEGKWESVEALDMEPADLMARLLDLFVMLGLLTGIKVEDDK